ncbi:MAG: hypothetical protein JNM88_08030 [Chitinophagaceae bacterium]|nr:hypothetical protein [Chitinophagaceae bacterium]
MKKPIWLFIPLLIACNNENPQPSRRGAASATRTAASPSVFITPPFTFDYQQQKKRCQELFALHRQKRKPDTERKLITYITDSLVPCWYGTPWDFNGTTQVPGEGKIACGYFVTTTLRDAGMKIDRVKMAQCVSQNLVYDMCGDFKKFSNKPLDYFVNTVKKSGFGLYIVGLDNHTGYIYHDGNEVWFIHSGVLAPRCALKEKAIESETLRRSAYRVVGRIRW